MLLKLHVIVETRFVRCMLHTSFSTHRFLHGIESS